MRIRYIELRYLLVFIIPLLVLAGLLIILLTRCAQPALRTPTGSGGASSEVETSFPLQKSGTAGSETTKTNSLEATWNSRWDELVQEEEEERTSPFGTTGSATQGTSSTKPSVSTPSYGTTDAGWLPGKW